MGVDNSLDGEFGGEFGGELGGDVVGVKSMSFYKKKSNTEVIQTVIRLSGCYKVQSHNSVTNYSLLIVDKIV